MSDLLEAVAALSVLIRDAARADADAVLEMIRHALRMGGCLHGHDDDHPQTPPMLYPEWIACAVAQGRAEQREADAKIAEAARGAGAHMLHNQVIATAIRSQR